MELLGVSAWLREIHHEGWPLERNIHLPLPQAQLLLLLSPQESPLNLPCLTLLLPGPVTAMRKNSDSRLTHFSALNSFAPIFFAFKVTARHLRETDEQTVGSTSTAQSSFRLPTKLSPPTHWSVLGCIMGTRPPHI